MERRITKKQAKHFARIMAGILLYNSSGEEFSNSDLTMDEETTLYKEIDNRAQIILKEDEYVLTSTNKILEYVRKHF